MTGPDGGSPDERPDRPPSSPSGRAGLGWVVGGVLAGAVAGGFDAAASVARGIGGLSQSQGLRLVGIAASLSAVAGSLLGSWCALGGWLASRIGGRAAPRAAPIIAALTAAPVVVYDAFALFAGHRAASLPGHAIISALLAGGGVFAVYGLAGAYARWLSPPSGRRPGRWLLALLLLAAAFLVELINRAVLPRLYGWFHATLAAATLTSFLLGCRLLWRRSGVAAAVAALIATAAASAASLGALRGSQVLRYAASERTLLAALALRALPARLRSPSTLSSPPSGRREDFAPLPALPEGPRRPEADVLLITVDALRADHVGAYGYARNTTPNIDALAAGGTRFARAYSQAPHTSFSVASLLTSKYFPTMARLAPGERHDPIAAVLRSYGWKTAAFYPPAVFFIDSEKMKTYAETNFDFEYVKFEFIDAQKRVDQVLAYYQTIEPKRSFVWIHFFEPHEPYEAHAAFPFGGSDIDRYDSEIAYTDAAVGRLVTEVRARRPGTIVILAADHGEEFDEHGGRYHGSSLYEEQLHVPLIVSVPGEGAQVIPGQVELVDVTPTILNLLDIPVPARMRGTDLGPWLAVPPAPSARLPPAFAELEDRRMVATGGEKLICDLRAGFCAYYDLVRDPREKRNLADEQPERAAYLRGLLDDWLDGHARLEPGVGPGSPNSAVALAPKAIERGRLGDSLAAPGLVELVTGAGPLGERREAAALLVDLPPRADTAAALTRASHDPDREIGDWAAIGASRLGDGAARARVEQIVSDGRAAPKLRVRAALALAAGGSSDGLSVLADGLRRCDDALFCRRVIVELGKLGDRRAVPVLLEHLGEVENRREMVDALGALGDPAAERPLLERLHDDEYVTVRVGAARALAEIGARDRGGGAARALAGRIELAVRHETEPTVIAAARQAAADLRAKRP